MTTTQATHDVSSHVPGRATSSAAFDHLMLVLATLLMLTVTASASILITLPESLDAVSAPAFGAPWMTASSAARVVPTSQPALSARHTCSAD